MGNCCGRSTTASANADADADADADEGSNMVWEKKLPPHYHKILSRAVSSRQYSSKKEIFSSLCNSILIEDGKQIIWLDPSTEKVGLMAAASDLVISWITDDKYWRWVSDDSSRFKKVAELIEVWWFEAFQRFECTLLSPNTEYSVAFLVKIDKNRMSSCSSPFVFLLKTPEGDLIESGRFLDDLEKPVESHGGLKMTPVRDAENGWMEFVAGEFVLKQDDCTGQIKVIDVSMKNDDCDFRKSGIFLDGVKITPKKV